MAGDAHELPVEAPHGVEEAAAHEVAAIGRDQRGQPEIDANALAFGLILRVKVRIGGWVPSSGVSMGLSSNVLAFGPGWRVTDVICTAGPHDRPFEEQHEAVCVAAVTEGTFQYRSTRGSALLSPGALLLGNVGHCFECGHEHGTGDRCLSFQLTPDYVESILAASDARQAAFGVPNLTPTQSLAPLLASAEAARDDGEAAEFEELTIALVGAVATVLSNTARRTRSPTRQDERRVTDALRLIERRAEDLEPALSLAELAGEVGMSPFHFLRMFRQVVGLTPYQFVLHTRLHRAAVRLRRSDEAVSSIALDVGFGDLSTFNRRFRRVIGLSPSVYRGRKGRANDFAQAVQTRSLASRP